MDFRYFLIFLSGLAGGIATYSIGTPLPFMLGGFLGAAIFVFCYERSGQRLPKISKWVRLIFIAIIGTLIGSRFTPELLTLLPQFWISALALIPFILIAHGISYIIMRRMGRYDPLTAYYASLPGGLVDSISLAEEHGADVRIVTAQHFIRVVLIVVTVPLLFWFISGDKVGSAAGETLSLAAYDWMDIVLVLVISWTGLFIGRFINMPVSHLLMPLMLTLALSLAGIITLNVPEWMQHLAQYIVGTALGAQFSGISRRLLLRCLKMGLICSVLLLLLAAGFAGVLANLVPAGFDVMFVSFAAAGLAEMSLIALSLNFNPIVVALHHFLRLFLSVWYAGYFVRYLQR